MLNNIYVNKVYLATGHTDMRKSIYGLAVLVKEVFKLDPFSPAMFVFCNRKKDTLKILFWECNGFWLYHRRLEAGKFNWPMNNEVDTLTVGVRELRWLLDGLSVNQERAHKKTAANILI